MIVAFKEHNFEYQKIKKEEQVGIGMVREGCKAKRRIRGRVDMKK